MSKSLIFGGYFVLIQFACGAQPDLSKLRDVMRLPVTSMQITTTYRPWSRVDDDPTTGLEPDVRIVALKRRLHGDNRDGATYMLIGEAYGDKEDTAKLEAAGKAAYAKAAEMFREQLAKSPGNGWIQSQLGSAYWELSELATAETWLRKAVKSAPNDGRCWANLGDFVSTISLSKVFSGHNEVDPASLPRLLEMLKQGPGLSGKLKSMQSADNEAHRAFDMAIKLAPADPNLLVRRSRFLLFDNMFTRKIIRIAGGESPDNSNPVTNEVVAGLRRAADLRPDNASIQGFALIHELALDASDITGGEFTSVEAKLAKLPAESRETFKTLFARNLKLASSPKSNTATIARVAACAVYGAMADNTDASEMALSAVKRDPDNELADTALDMCLATTGKFADLASALHKQIAHKDTALKRLWLAKTYDHLNRPADVMEQVKAGLQAIPNDFLLNLAWADVLMKRPDTASLKRAGDALMRCSDLFDKLNGTDQQANLTNYNYAHGIYIALTGNTDAARQALNEVLKQDPADKNTRAALDALGKDSGK